MENDAGQANHNWNCMDDEFAEQSLYPEALGISDAFRDPELLPRTGDQYQAEIPPVMTVSAYLLFTEKANDSMITPSTPHDSLLGLPISLMWIKEEVKNTKHEPEEFPGDSNGSGNRKDAIKLERIRETHSFPGSDLIVKTQPTDIVDGRLEVRKLAMLDMQEDKKNQMYPHHGGNGYHMVPGSVGCTWNDLEEASFLLGLYIFGKNLIQVKKFVESKKMGDILSFYYGKFYRSDRYRRWSECRKIRSRRCIYGQRIFTGSIHQELLSRLFLHVSEGCQNTLLEVAKTFGEGKILIDEYVFTLKAIVGLNALVEAVGIGKGKQDLTGIAMEPLKSNQVPVRPEIPVGKACSFLTPLEIVNFLTGGYRLSKARSNDLFWEAVWPRLLARGWHSEQPNDHSSAAASRHSLVFLIPGIKKFSRRQLIKGNHYFDSVSDVLNKVASDPALLELDFGSDKGCGDKEENGWNNEKILEQGDFSNQQRHCYLKPRTPSRSTEVMKFTIVDTSLVNGDTAKVRELKSLPVEMINISTSRSDSEESDEDSSEDATDESDSSDKMCFDQNKTDISKSAKVNDNNVDSSERVNFENNALKLSTPTISSGIIKVPINIPKDQNASKWDDIQPRKPIKSPVIKRMKPGDKSLLAPVAKRRRGLAACDRMPKSCGTVDLSVDGRLKQDEVCCISSNSDLRENIFSHPVPHQAKMSSASSSSRDSPNITDECTLSSNSSVAEHPNEKFQSRTLIDLNFPIPQDAETESLMMEMTERKHDQESEQPEDSVMLKTSTSVCDSTCEQPSNMNSRRQSTRNRPPTTKALEALACGFLSIKQRRSRRDDFPLGNSLSRPSRRACSRVRITENFGTGVVDFKEEERVNGVCKSNGDVFSEPQLNLPGEGDSRC